MSARSLIISALFGVLFLSCTSKTGPGPAPDLTTDPIPKLSIETNGNTIVNEPKVPVTYQVWLQDELIQEGNAGIEYRGSTSHRLFDKKSYGLETWDINGEDMDVPLLDFPEEEDWILYGPYSDKTLIRNVLLMELARELGHYAPKTEFIELDLNGEYQGLYVFMEKIKRDNNRLDISKLDSDENDAATITGGYILKIDKTAGDTGNDGWDGDENYTPALGFRSAYGAYGDSLSYPAYGSKQGEETYFLYEEPGAEDITEQQKEYIQQYIHDFEKAFLSDDLNTETRTYTNFIELNSFVDFFILNELSANPDAYRLSTYLHKDRDGKLAMGPVWDFNIAWGNDWRSSTETWIYQYNQYQPGDLWLVHFWWPRLLEDPQFRAAVKSRWQELRSSVLSDENLDEMIGTYLLRLTEQGAVARNFDRWQVLGTELPFNSYVGSTYEDETNYLNDWIDLRTSWLDAQISAF